METKIWHTNHEMELKINGEPSFHCMCTEQLKKDSTVVVAVVVVIVLKTDAPRKIIS
jgi:hypothetical protein